MTMNGKAKAQSAWVKAPRIILLCLVGLAPLFLIGYPTRFRDVYLICMAAALGALMAWLLYAPLFNPPSQERISLPSAPGLLTLTGVGLGLAAVLLVHGFWPYISSGKHATPPLPLSACLAVLLISSLLICVDGSSAGRGMLGNRRVMGMLTLTCLVIISVSFAAAFYRDAKTMYLTGMQVSLALGAGACLAAVIATLRSGKDQGPSPGVTGFDLP